MALKKQNGTDNVLLQTGDALLLQDESAGATLTASVDADALLISKSPHGL